MGVSEQDEYGDAPIRRHLRLLLTPLAEEPRQSATLGVGTLEALAATIEAVLAAQSAPRAAVAMLDSVVTTYGFPRGAVLLGQDRLTVVASHGVLSPSSGPGVSRCVDRAHDEQSPQLVRGLRALEEPWLALWLPTAADLLVIPLHVNGRALGALLLQVPVSMSEQVTDTLMGFLERACRSCAFALQRFQQIELLERLAATDGLTKIANRRSFDAFLERELARSVRSGEPLSLVLLDIDHFKHVNDRYGHPAGDEALRNIAAALTLACREFDTPARYGGEEFAIILPDCDLDTCVSIADRLRAAVAAAPAVLQLTASAGVATFPTHGVDAEGLVQAADKALLVAKADGRDRTVLALPLPTDMQELAAAMRRPRLRDPQD